MALGSLYQKERDSGQMGLFDMEEEKQVSSLTYPAVPEYPIEMRLAMEKEYDGFYFSGHPLDAFHDIMDRLTPYRHYMENIKSSMMGGSWK